ncbi:MAG: hypothetical protein ACFB03_05775 [Paracoccaceae bacterium]
MPHRTLAHITRLIGSHWRGETPLLQVVLINLVALGMALALLQEFIRGSAEAVIVGTAILCCSAVPIWQIVGYVRTSRAHLISGGDPFLPWAGHVALVSILLVTVSQTIGSILSLERYQPPPEAPSQRPVLAISDKGVLAMSGDIDYATLGAFQTALQDGPAVTRIDLQSNGGLVYAARAIADIVQARRFDTHVPEFCNSACTLIFAAGQHRTLAPDARLGFHRYGKPTKFHQLLVDADDEYAKDLRYLQGRGVSDAFLEKLLTVENDDMWFPTRADIEAAGLLTPLAERRD